MNESLGVEVDVDMASKSAMGVKEILEKDEELRQSALHNSRENFADAYYDHLNNALVQGSEDSKQFFYLLLKKEIMGIFIDELYQKFRGEEKTPSYSIPNDYGLKKVATHDSKFGK